MGSARSGIVVLLAMAAGGCGSFGGLKSEQAPDPNTYPANYRRQIASFLTTQLMDRTDFGGALIAAPAIKPVAESQRYVVCLQLNGHNQRKDKVVIYLTGDIQQFVDSKPEQCADATYQPFQELAKITPPR
jgi:hypothetical protein